MEIKPSLYVTGGATLLYTTGGGRNSVPVADSILSTNTISAHCGSPPGVIVADTLSFNAKMDLVDF